MAFKIINEVTFFILSKKYLLELKNFLQYNGNRYLHSPYENCIVLRNKKQMVVICNIEIIKKCSRL